MKSKLITAFIIIVAVAGAMLIKIKAAEYVNSQVETGKNSKEDLQAVIDNQGEVAISIKPVEVSKNGRDWIFEIELNTHSVELTDDLQQSIVLKTNDGREYKPILYQGSPAGGHHRSGILTFSRINPYPQSIELIAKKIGGIEQRAFNWKLY